LGMATLAAQFIIPWVLEHPLAEYTNGSRPLNVPAPVIGPFNTYATFGDDSVFTDETVISFDAGNSIIVDYVTIVLATASETAPQISVRRATVTDNGDVISNEDLADSAFTTQTGDNTTRI